MTRCMGLLRLMEGPQSWPGPLLQVQVDISTSAQVCTEIRRALSNFVEDNADQFVVGGSNVIFLDSQDPLKMTMGIVYTFPHNGEQLCQNPTALNWLQ